MTVPFAPIADYRCSLFVAPGSASKRISRDVYRRGSGAPVVIIQELPRIGAEILRLADEFIARDFAVILLHLFGPLEKISMGGNLVRVFCMRNEFSLFESKRFSPVVDCLKALCQQAKAQGEPKGVGATRVINHTLPGKGRSVLTIDFVDEQGHPTQEALNEILAYFAAQLR